jgi:cation-transporting ATPase E
MVGLAAQESFGYSADGAPVLPEGMRLAGLIAFEDELQPNVHETIRHFADAGIELKIISGDHPETVAALALQAGFSISGDGQLVSGLALAEMDDAAFARAAEQATVFGRITPEQKLEIIRALQKAGRYVAMTGDGVNDVLALKQAQVGIAMESGSQASRAVADLVLLGNSFASLPHAFAEGQRIVRGTQDLIKLFIARSLSLAIAILGAGVLAAPFPVLPTHSAVPAFLVLGVPTLGIAAWTKPGRVPRSFLRAVLPFAMPAALSIGAVETVVFVSYLRATDDLNLARTMVTLVAVLCGLLLIIFVRPPVRSLAAMEELTDDWKPTLMAGIMLSLLALFLVSPNLRDFFQLSALDAGDVAIGTGIVVAWAVTLQIGWRQRWLERWLQLEPPA